MARQRIIKPEFWTNERVVDCSPTSRLLFIGLWNFSDDGGVHPASLKTLKMQIFPGDDYTSEDIRRMVDELLANGLVIEYEVGGRAYWKVTGWDHQKIEYPTYMYPNPDGIIPKSPPRGKRRVGDNSESRRYHDGDKSESGQRPVVPKLNKQSQAKAALSSTTVTDKAAAAGPLSPPTGEPAAAALSEIEVQKIIDKVVEIRVKRSKKNGKPVKSPATLRGTLVDALAQNPLELNAWLEQIAEDEQKTEEEKIRQEELQKRFEEESRLEEEQRREKARINQGMKVFESLSEEEKAELGQTAEDMELRALDPEIREKGIKPFRVTIERRIVRLLEEQGYLENEETLISSSNQGGES
ncbi:MAG: hypothetical protein AB7F28_00200 [Candidatus Margulisiibacteriota bacterium]